MIEKSVNGGIAGVKYERNLSAAIHSKCSLTKGVKKMPVRREDGKCIIKKILSFLLTVFRLLPAYEQLKKCTLRKYIVNQAATATVTADLGC